jgi:hypothetical protein
MRSVSEANNPEARNTIETQTIMPLIIIPI